MDVWRMTKCIPRYLLIVKSFKRLCLDGIWNGNNLIVRLPDDHHAESYFNPIHCLIEGHDLHFFAVSQIYAIDVKNELKV